MFSFDFLPPLFEHFSVVLVLIVLLLSVLTVSDVLNIVHLFHIFIACSYDLLLLRSSTRIIDSKALLMSISLEDQVQYKNCLPFILTSFWQFQDLDQQFPISELMSTNNYGQLFFLFNRQTKTSQSKQAQHSFHCKILCKIGSELE